MIYHLRLRENFYLFFFLKKKFQKSTSVNFVGSDPRLLEKGAKWRTHWALKLEIGAKGQKIIKGVRGLAQEAQPSDLYPYATKSDTWVQKKSSKNSKKQFSLFKKFNQDIAKWRTHWAIIFKVKKNKGCQRAGSRGTALWPVPICQKIWHMGTKKIIKKQQKTVFFV